MSIFIKQLSPSNICTTHSIINAKEQGKM